MDIFKSLFNEVKKIKIIDTHEHLPGHEEGREKSTDILREYTTHYISRDLVSTGLKLWELEKVRDAGLPITERWELVKEHWENVRNTGYARALDITVKELYGADRICGDNIEFLDAEFKKTLAPGHFHKVLKEKSNIQISLLDSDIGCDRSFFRSVYRMDHLIFPCTGSDIMQVEKDSGITVTCLDDWLDASEKIMDKVLINGVVALKSILAYKRSLKYERATYREAEESFRIIFDSARYIDRIDQVFITDKPFQDYMMHYILKLAGKRNLTYQFHTGLQEGHGNILSNSDPSLLSNLFLEYPDVDFDLFHMSYPYQNIAAALCKNFSNVFLDMCWAHIISPNSCVNALLEWLDSVPVNKISAFGGDYLFVDAIYGHQYMARTNVCKALAEKVAQGLFSEDRALETANMLFYKNPYKIFKLEGKL